LVSTSHASSANGIDEHGAVDVHGAVDAHGAVDVHGATRPFRIERGVLRGVIDLVLAPPAPDGVARTFFLDWKSDRLPSFAAPMLRAHVDQHYALQARIYTLGVLRLLGVRDEAQYEATFGGLLYAFLRGMDPSRGVGAGVVFARPRWDEVVSWERELRESDTPFGYALAPLREGS
jgi:exodeoxyribonuclease V beta subunit